MKSNKSYVNYIIIKGVSNSLDIGMSAFRQICDSNYLKRLGSNKNETFRETIQRFLTRFPDPVHEIVHGIDYQIISGFFNIFFIYLIYYCPSTEKYLYYGIHRDSTDIFYKDNFPEEIPAFLTFEQTEEYIYQSLKDAYT